MNAKASPAGLLVFLVSLLIFALAAPAAFADTTDIIEPQLEPPNAEHSGFQAGTCTANFFDPEPPPPPLQYCSEETPSLFYEEAAGHPPIGFTQYLIEHDEPEALPSPPYPTGKLAPLKEPILGRSIKTLRVDLPPGLSVNPEATPRCSLTDFINVIPMVGIIPKCDDGTIVGEEEVTLVTNANEVELPPPAPPGTKVPKGFILAPTPGISKVPVFNLQPKEGEPALFGFIIALQRVIFIEGGVAWESDYHESFRIKPPEPTIPGFSTLLSRLVNFGQDAGNKKLEGSVPNQVVVPDPTDPEGDGTFITLPTTCFDPVEWPDLYSTWFRAESYEVPNPTFPDGSTPFEAEIPPGTQVEGCAEVPFDPGIEVDPGTAAVDSPSPATVTTTLPFDPETEGGVNRMQSHLRSARVTLPQGMGLNPSAANTVVACTDAQFAKGARVEDNSCPAGSRIGTAEVETPPLPPGTLKGDVYVGEQKSSDPASGEMFRILAEAKSKQYGVVARLIGHVSADPATGQLTTVLDDQLIGPLAGPLPNGLPQVPFESVTLSFDDSDAVLTSPPTCAPNGTTSVMEPWSTPSSTATPSSSFTLINLPGGGACPQTLAERPFGPGFLAGTRNTQAGAYSAFDLGMHRGDGAQEFRRVDVTLPPGMSAKLRGVEYCPEASIAAAAGRTGKSELATPSCPAGSLLGTVGIDAGSGANPFHSDGKVYFAGPYKGAPVSLVFVTPAVAGPFDLGVVVVRTALNVDPETAVVKAVSDPIPYIFGGVKLDVRSIVVNIDRQGYTVNPTTCREQSSVNADIFGGAGDPDDPAAWSLVKQDHPFRATGCKSLKFKPKFFARILGGKKQTRRTANPKFRTVLKAREGDANLRRAAFILPRATILDQSHIQTVCTRVQLAANSCPKQAVYGKAKATSPLLDGRLQGPVYLTSSDNQLPDLLVDLRGQVNVRLRGVISSKNGRLKTVFRTTPDVAVKQFTLEMEGGDQGLLVNSQNLCGKTRTGFLNLKAQNSRQVKSKKLRLNIPACSKGKKR